MELYTTRQIHVGASEQLRITGPDQRTVFVYVGSDGALRTAQDWRERVRQAWMKLRISVYRLVSRIRGIDPDEDRFG